MLASVPPCRTAVLQTVCRCRSGVERASGERFADRQLLCIDNKKTGRQTDHILN